MIKRKWLQYKVRNPTADIQLADKNFNTDESVELTSEPKKKIMFKFNDDPTDFRVGPVPNPNNYDMHSPGMK